MGDTIRNSCQMSFPLPGCSGGRAWAPRSRALDQCVSCGHQVSLTAGTVFHGTRKPLALWFRVIGQFLVSKSGWLGGGRLPPARAQVRDGLDLVAQAAQ